MLELDEPYIISVFETLEQDELETDLAHNGKFNKMSKPLFSILN